MATLKKKELKGLTSGCVHIILKTIRYKQKKTSKFVQCCYRDRDAYGDIYYFCFFRLTICISCFCHKKCTPLIKSLTRNYKHLKQQNDRLFLLKFNTPNLYENVKIKSYILAKVDVIIIIFREKKQLKTHTNLICVARVHPAVDDVKHMCTTLHMFRLQQPIYSWISHQLTQFKVHCIRHQRRQNTHTHIYIFKH